MTTIVAPPWEEQPTAGGIADAMLRSDLASGSGSGLVRYQPVGTGAVATTVQSKLREFVSVKDFGAVGDGLTDDTSAFQSAINTGRRIIVPKGVYILSQSLNIITNGQQIHGEGITSTTIYQSVANIKIFNITANNVSIRDVSMDYTGTPILGAVAIYSSGSGGKFFNFKVNRCHKGIELTAVDSQAHHFEIYNYAYAGVHLNGASGIYVKYFILDALSSSNGAGGGIVMSNKTEGCIFSDGDILNGIYSLFTEALVYSAGSRPAYSRFNNVFFDSSAAGVYIDKVADFTFENCWFSAGRSADGQSGCNLGTTDSVSFIGTTFANCGAHGVSVSSFSQRTSFIGCKSLGNSVTTGTGISHGFYFAQNATSFILEGCTACNTIFVGTQGYGIYIESGSSNIYNIVGCNLAGNFTGAIFDGGSGVSKAISNNIGYLTAYRSTGIVPSGASSVTFDHYLNGTPTIDSVVLSPQYKKSYSGITDFWVSEATATTLTVTTDVNTTNAFSFTFDARIKGA